MAARPAQPALWLCTQLGIEPESLGWAPLFNGGGGLASNLVSKTIVAEAANDNEPQEEEETDFKSSASIDALTRPGGFIEELIDWIVSSAEHPSRELALSAIIPFAGALIGRRFKGYRDARSNVYSIALAPSGYGKDHARQQIKRLISAKHLHHYAGRRA